MRAIVSRETSSSPPLAPAAQAERLARRMEAIPDPRMRRAAMSGYLAETPASQAIPVLVELVRAASAALGASQTVAVDSLNGALSTPGLLPYETRATLYAAAKGAGQLQIARLFFDASAAIGTEESELAEERPLRPRGRPLTLGERKSLARSHKRDIRENLLRDPHPAVVGILLSNPHTTEADVLRIATRRPAEPESLALIAAHTRWGSRYPIKRALTYNPRTPVHLAIRLLTTLRAADLRQVAADSHLAAPVREQARELLRLR